MEDLSLLIELERLSKTELYKHVVECANLFDTLQELRANWEDAEDYDYKFARMMDELEDREFSKVRELEKSDLEPIENSDAWSGGFADNH